MRRLEISVRELFQAAKERIDFDECFNEIETLEDQVIQSGSLLDSQKNQLLSILKTITRSVENRRDNLDEFINALNVSLQSHEIFENLTDELARWYFYLAYRDAKFERQHFDMLERLLSKSNSNKKENKKKFYRDLRSYAWFAKNGCTPELSKNNLQGLLLTSQLAPLDEADRTKISSEVSELLEASEERRVRLGSSIFSSCLENYQNTLRQAKIGYKKSGSYLDQTNTFGIRVSLSGLQGLVDNSEEYSDEQKAEFSDTIGELESELDEVGYRSSAAIYYKYYNELESLFYAIDTSIDFQNARKDFFRIRDEVEECANKGREGVNKLHPFHHKQLKSQLSSCYNNLAAALDDVERFNEEIKILEERINDLLSNPSSSTRSGVKKITSKLSNSGPFLYWSSKFKNSEKQTSAKDKIEQLRLKGNELWELMKQNERTRLNEFNETIEQAGIKVINSEDLPFSLAELLELRKGIDEFAPYQRGNLLKSLGDAFSEFEKQCKNLSKLDSQISDFERRIDGFWNKIYRDIPFGDLFSTISWMKRWASLKAFPGASKASYFAKINGLRKKVYILETRQKKFLENKENRSAEIYALLKDDFEKSAASALSAPADPENWDSLIEAQKTLWKNSRPLTSDHYKSLKEILDGAFAAVKASRTEFAVKSEERFSECNDILEEAELQLEAEQSRESAFYAIEILKSVRAIVSEKGIFLKSHRQQLREKMNYVSRLVEETFDSAESSSNANMDKINRLISLLNTKLLTADSWKDALQLIDTHKSIFAEIRNTSLAFSHRRELKVRMETLWNEISEKLQILRSWDRRSETPEELCERLENAGYLMFVSQIPRASVNR